MTFHFVYSVIAGSTYGYVIGRMHERGHVHWKNAVVAVAAGIFWPVTLLCGIYLVHAKKDP